MSEVVPEIAPEKATLALKILYTLHGVDSQKYVVKPANLFNVVVFREIGLGVVDIKQCLAAIREASPDFASVCDTHGDEFAVYSADYAEEGLPLQSHGRVSQKAMIDATGALTMSRMMKEHLEVLIHLLPIRKPNELIADFVNAQKTDSDMMGSETGKAPPVPPAGFPCPPASLMNSSLLQSLPALPPPVQIPPSLQSSSKPSMRSDPALPSSPPPMRARGPPESKSSSGVTTASKRASAEGSTSKRRKASSPKVEGESQCSNCGVATASTWRRVESSDGKKDLLCNACGLYYKSKHVMRPSFLWDKMRTRGEADQVAQQQPKVHPLAQPRPAAPPVAQKENYIPDQTMLWSQGPQNYMPNSADISDRLLDRPKLQDERRVSAAHATDTQVHDPHIYTMPEPPRTPERKSTSAQPLDSIQKLFDVNTPDQKTNMMMPVSGSASKWLRRVMNTEDFEDFLRTPTPRKTRNNDLSILTSSPPTSSNLFSEINDWAVYGTGSPHNKPVKLFREDTIELPEQS